jgi:hypothetical protein
MKMNTLREGKSTSTRRGFVIHTFVALGGIAAVPGDARADAEHEKVRAAEQPTPAAFAPRAYVPPLMSVVQLMEVDVEGNGVLLGTARAMLASRVGAVRACFDNAQRTTPGLGAGGVHVELVLDRQGHVTLATAVASTLPMRPVAVCMRGVMRTIAFPVSAGATTTKVKATFTMRPAPGAHTPYPSPATRRPRNSGGARM